MSLVLYQAQRTGESIATGGTTMRTLRILGLAALGPFVLAQDAMAEHRGGAVSGGVRGAVVGGMVGGSEGAATGAKVGVVTGATRPPLTGNRKRIPSTRPPLHTRMPRPRTSAKHRRTSSAPPQQVRSKSPAARRSFARMASPSWGSHFLPIGSRGQATTTSRRSVGMDRPTRCSSPPRGSLTNRPASKKSR